MSFFAQNTSETGQMVDFYLFKCLVGYRAKYIEQNALKVHILFRLLQGFLYNLVSLIILLDHSN